MNPLEFKLFFLITALLVAIVLGGCIQFGFDAELAKLKAMQERYSLKEELAPKSLQEMNSFKVELNRLKQQTKDSAFSSLLDIRINSVETIENLVLAGLELQRTNPVDVDCTENSPLLKAIELLKKALAKGELAKKRLESFNSENPQLAEKAMQMGFTETRIAELNKAIKEQLDSANELKRLSCT